MREIRRDNECSSETNKKPGFEECHSAPGMRPEKGHLAPEVQMVNVTVYGTSCTPPFL
jgi:hypothetical protein